MGRSIASAITQAIVDLADAGSGNAVVAASAADGLGVTLCLAPMMLQELRTFMRQDSPARLPRRRQSDQPAQAAAHTREA